MHHEVAHAVLLVVHNVLWHLHFLIVSLGEETLVQDTRWVLLLVHLDEDVFLQQSIVVNYGAEGRSISEQSGVIEPLELQGLWILGNCSFHLVK